MAVCAIGGGHPQLVVVGVDDGAGGGRRGAQGEQAGGGQAQRYGVAHVEGSFGEGLRGHLLCRTRRAQRFTACAIAAGSCAAAAGLRGWSRPPSRAPTSTSEAPVDLTDEALLQ